MIFIKINKSHIKKKIVGTLWAKSIIKIGNISGCKGSRIYLNVRKYTMVKD